MKQRQFEQLYSDTWQEFEIMLDALDNKSGRKRKASTNIGLDKFPQLFRKVCHFHSLAKNRNYSSMLVDRLSGLIVRGHQHLYRKKTFFFGQFIRFFLIEFPSLVRKEYKLFWLATALLYVPALAFALCLLINPELVYTVVGPTQVTDFEEMYNPANRTLGSARDSGTNWGMFGYYIYNNISVSFNAYASGLLWGVGSFLILIYNGLLFGAVAGHLINVEFSETFFTFVIAHGSFELTAIVISGAAGIRLGLSLLFPGNLKRSESLKRAAHVSIKLIYGVIGMLVIAAFIEAFWSSNNVFLPWQKYVVGAALWFVVIVYLLFSGRRYESE